MAEVVAGTLPSAEVVNQSADPSYLDHVAHKLRDGLKHGKNRSLVRQPHAKAIEE